MRRNQTLVVVIGFLAGLAPGCWDLGEMRAAPPSAAGPDAGGAAPDASAAPRTPEAVLAEWSGCMTIENWRSSGMAAWAQKATEGGTVCSSCHADGLGHVDTSADGDVMFEHNRYQTFITGFFTLSSDSGRLEVVPASAKLEGVAGGANDHLTFASGAADPQFQALESFHELTRQARDAGTCAPAGFP